MVDIVGFTTDGVNIVYGNGRSNFIEKGGSTIKKSNYFRSNEGYLNAWDYPR